MDWESSLVHVSCLYLLGGGAAVASHRCLAKSGCQAIAVVHCTPSKMEHNKKKTKKNMQTQLNTCMAVSKAKQQHKKEQLAEIPVWWPHSGNFYVGLVYIYAISLFFTCKNHWLYLCSDDRLHTVGLSRQANFLYKCLSIQIEQQKKSGDWSRKSNKTQ